MILNATDADSEDNSKIQYSILNPINGFSIGQYDGVLKVNLSNITTLNEDVVMTIKATDMGNPPMHSMVPVRIKVSTRSISGHSGANKMDYKYVLHLILIQGVSYKKYR